MDDNPVMRRFEAVSRLRAVLISGTSVAEALRWGVYQDPTFCFLLLAGAVQGRFGNRDMSEITLLAERIGTERSADPLGFPLQEAEVLMRLALGEMDLVEQLDPAEVNYPEIAISVLGSLFAGWLPSPGEVNELFSQTELAGDILGHVASDTGGSHPFTQRCVSCCTDLRNRHRSPFVGHVGEDGVPNRPRLSTLRHPVLPGRLPPRQDSRGQAPGTWLTPLLDARFDHPSDVFPLLYARAGHSSGRQPGVLQPSTGAAV